MDVAARHEGDDERDDDANDRDGHDAGGVGRVSRTNSMFNPVKRDTNNVKALTSILMATMGLMGFS